MNERRWILGAGAVSVLGLVQTGGAAARSGATQGIPNIAVQSHTGKSFRFYDDLVKDKVVVISMMYAGCTSTCPPSTYNLVQVQQMLGQRVGRDIFMYSITVRPDQDSALDLAAYAKAHKVQPGWLFLTGAPQDIEKLRYALGFYDPDPAVDKQEGRHVGMVRIGNDPFRRWGMAPALADPRQIVSAILHVDRKPPPRPARIATT